MTINLDTNHLSRLLSESSQAEKHETYKNQKNAQNTKKMQFECYQVKCISLGKETLPSRNISSTSRDMTFQKMKKSHEDEPSEKASRGFY